MSHPVDNHVGKRMRELRTMRGFSQSHVARKLGLSFQQIQKYEIGTNRISASRLYEIADLLNVKPSYFFEGLSGQDQGNELPMDHETAKIASLIARISDDKVKRRINTLIHEIVGDAA